MKYSVKIGTSFLMDKDDPMPTINSENVSFCE